MYTPTTLFSSLIEIERKRSLEQPARVLVRRGQVVQPEDVIAESLIGSSHILLDAARSLGIDPKQAEPYLHCKVDTTVFTGDLLAGPIGIARRVCRAPQDGKVVLIHAGKILIEVKAPPAQCLAGFPGDVVELIPDSGAIIRTVGGLVQGVWGNSKIATGALSLPAQAPDAELTPSMLEANEGEIIAGGCITAPEMFIQSTIPVIKGMILGSLNPDLIGLASQASWPVMIIDGFGKRPMNSTAWEVLSGLVSKSITINAARRNRRSGVRPEAIAPISGIEVPAPVSAYDLLMPGQAVRITDQQASAQVGVLVDMIGEIRFPGGCLAEAARVHLEGSEEILVPLANLERLA